MGDENDQKDRGDKELQRERIKRHEASRELRDRDADRSPERHRAPKGADAVPEAPPPGQEHDPFAGLQPIDDIDEREES
jgi:hypothetical protein